MNWKNLCYTLLLTTLLLSNAKGQKRQDFQILLKSGSFVPERNVASATSRANAVFRLSTAGQKSFVVIQFDDIPTEEERRQLRAEGIELLDYLPNYAYTATIAAGSNPGALARTQGRAIVELSPEQKMQPDLANGNIPPHAFSGPTTVDLWISYPKSFTDDEIQAALQKNSYPGFNGQNSAISGIPASTTMTESGRPSRQ